MVIVYHFFVLVTHDPLSSKMLISFSSR